MPDTAYLHEIGFDRWRHKTRTCTKWLRLVESSKTLFRGWFPQVNEYTLMNAYKDDTAFLKRRFLDIRIHFMLEFIVLSYITKKRQNKVSFDG